MTKGLRAQQRGPATSYIFGTNAGAHQNVIESCSEENTANMAAVNKNDDPDQGFQRLQAGSFLVSKACTISRSMCFRILFVHGRITL
jgi:hypothetical protein